MLDHLKLSLNFDLKQVYLFSYSQLYSGSTRHNWFSSVLNNNNHNILNSTDSEGSSSNSSNSCRYNMAR